MTTLLVNEWLNHLDKEYLASYVTEGGAAVKFAVACDGVDPVSVITTVEDLGKRRGFVVARVDSAATRIHLVDRVLMSIAAQVPWDAITTAVVSRLATQSGLTVPATLTSEGLADQLAATNEVDVSFVQLTLNREIANQVFKDRNLAKDFRVAMTWLCRARLNGGSEGATISGDITGWLRGEVRAISAMKQYQIYTKVNRANARYLLESTFSWIRGADRAGTMVVLDIRRLTDYQRPTDGSNYYTKSSLLDAYEVLRQFIDSTDDLEGALICVVADEFFLDTEVGKRGIAAYQALMNRIFDEVRDRTHVNPMASLVRLGIEAGG